jgi:outer membrane protein OmpA-like peptidoglycan-associated protein
MRFIYRIGPKAKPKHRSAPHTCGNLASLVYICNPLCFVKPNYFLKINWLILPVAPLPNQNSHCLCADITLFSTHITAPSRIVSTKSKKDKVMINVKKACLLATLGGALYIPVAMAAQDTAPHQVVNDADQDVVVSTNGNCVVTKWTSNVDECKTSVRLSKEQRTVYFDFNKSTLNASEKAKLDNVAKAVKASKEVKSVDIVGFADQIGNNSYNASLSKRRAETVKSYLSAKGLKTNKVRVEGMGEENPVTNCDSSAPRAELIACLAADRRVEVMLNLVK